MRDRAQRNTSGINALGDLVVQLQLQLILGLSVKLPAKYEEPDDETDERENWLRREPLLRVWIEAVSEHQDDAKRDRKERGSLQRWSRLSAPTQPPRHKEHGSEDTAGVPRYTTATKA